MCNIDQRLRANFTYAEFLQISTRKKDQPSKKKRGKGSTHIKGCTNGSKR